MSFTVIELIRKLQELPPYTEVFFVKEEYDYLESCPEQKNEDFTDYLAPREEIVRFPKLWNQHKGIFEKVTQRPEAEGIRVLVDAKIKFVETKREPWVETPPAYSVNLGALLLFVATTLTLTGCSSSLIVKPHKVVPLPSIERPVYERGWSIHA